MMMEFSHELKKKTESADAIIREMLPEIKGPQRIIMEAMNYSVEAGGKRIRPILISECYELFQRDPERDAFMRPVLGAFMTAMEMIHTFSLCHDDLPCMDGDQYRRGRESTWYKYGEDMGTLAGDALSLYAFELIGKAWQDARKQSDAACAADAADGAAALRAAEKMFSYSDSVLRAMHILAEKAGISGMIGGQVLDVQMTGRPLGEEQLQFIYEKKTGALIEGSMMIGACLAGASADELKQMERIGSSIGVAFQIQDDILDETSTSEVLGKPIHSDLENNKTTYVSLHGIADAGKEVERLSEEAVRGLMARRTDANASACAFLTALTEALIHREK